MLIRFFLVRMDQGEDEADDQGDEADAEEDEEDGEEGLHNPIDKDTIIFLPEQSAEAIYPIVLSRQDQETVGNPVAAAFGAKKPKILPRQDFQRRPQSCRGKS